MSANLRRTSAVLVCLAALCLTACDDDETYPSVITELADCITDAGGNLTTLRTDEGVSYTLTNPLSGLTARAMYRCLCGYYLGDEDGTATLHSLSNAYYLRDSTAVAQRDDFTIVSAWQTDRYINLHLQHKTAGGTHYYGYVIDAVEDDHVYISLHHNRNGDATSYSADVYASIPLDSIRQSVITLQNKYEFSR